MGTHARKSGAAPPRAPDIQQHILMEALDADGRRYDAGKLARLLDWTLKDMGIYLKKDASTVSRFGGSALYQDALASLAALILRMRNLFGSIELAAAWTRTPIHALNGASPKELILEQNLQAIHNLLSEMESGFAL
jgi:hypothetical protein